MGPVRQGTIQQSSMKVKAPHSSSRRIQMDNRPIEPWDLLRAVRRSNLHLGSPTMKASFIEARSNQTFSVLGDPSQPTPFLARVHHRKRSKETHQIKAMSLVVLAPTTKRILLCIRSHLHRSTTRSLPRSTRITRLHSLPARPLCRMPPVSSKRPSPPCREYPSSHY